MIREILGLALIAVGLISLIAQIIATGRRAAALRASAARLPRPSTAPRGARRLGARGPR